MVPILTSQHTRQFRSSALAFLKSTTSKFHTIRAINSQRLEFSHYSSKKKEHYYTFPNTTMSGQNASPSYYNAILPDIIETLKIKDNEETKWEPVMEKFRKHLDEDKKRKQDLEESVKNALACEIPEMEILGIKNTESFLKYMNKLIRWVPMESFDGKDVYYHLVMFYFVLNQKPFGRRQTAIKPGNYGGTSWMTRWLVEYAQAVGSFCDEPESLTKETLATFKKSPSYKMNNYMEPRGGWKTFNQFFARSFKPGYRTIYGLDDPSVLVSPADCTYSGAWNIRADSKVTLKCLEWSIAELLRGSPYGQEFQGGVFTHSFLNTFDYHRLHTPVGGKVLESRVIQGQCYLETAVVPKDEGSKGMVLATRSVDAPNTPGYQFVQMRGLAVIDSPVGLVAVLPIGMATVSSVIMTAEVGVSLRKGEEIGYFQFGGSDIVMVFQAKARVALTAVEGIHLSMGMPVGTAKVQP